MSKVISLRVSDSVYDMACFCKNEEIKAFEKAQSEGAYLPNIVQGISVNEFCNVILCNAIGKRYTELKNGC